MNAVNGQIPASFVEKLIDRSDTATAKEISNLEEAITQLVLKLNTPPRIEDVNRVIEDVRILIKDEVNKKLDQVVTDIKTSDISYTDDSGHLRVDIKSLSECVSELSANMSAMLTKIKWVAGIVSIVVVVAVGAVNFVTSITKDAIQADLAIELRRIEETSKKEHAAVDEKFIAILEEIKRTHK